MKTAIRLIVMLFVIAASLAAFNTPTTPKNAMVYAEGSSPRPLCAPGEPCGPNDDLAVK